MRLIFHNPHIDDFIGRPAGYLITRKKALKKYSFLADIIRHKEKFWPEKHKQVVVYADSWLSSVYPAELLRKFPALLRYPLIYAEMLVWLVINRINPFKVKLKLGKLKPTSKDVIIGFSFKSGVENFDKNIELLNQSKLNLVHLSHYFVRTNEKSENYENIGKIVFFAENDLQQYSEFFRHYYSWYQYENVYLLPFVPQERFENLTTWENRKGVCIATGTYHNLRKDVNLEYSKDFVNFFDIDCYHPMRKVLSENKETLKGMMDVRISFFDEESVKKKATTRRDSKLKKIMKRIYNAFNYKQKKYFSFDIAQLYNQYKMAIIPEEKNGLPGIGFIESMASGCAYIGEINPMYAEIGLKSGEHYIGYNGSLEDLKSQIEYYQKNDAELQKIAVNGYQYIRKHFNRESVSIKFLDDITKSIETDSPIQSSFII